MDDVIMADENLLTATSHNVSVINAACQQILKQMEQQLLTLLKKNRKEQEIVEAYLSVNCKDSHFETVKKNKLKCAGMPYFKDCNGFQPPPNEDVIRKQNNDKLLPVDILKSFPIWSSADVRNLLHAVKEYDISNPQSIDWMKISVTDLGGKYSPSECRSKWNMHLNPNINRSKWSLKETELLKEVAAKHNHQDWDKIASELGTNRTGLQCCIQYQTHTFPTEGRWTKQEDETLEDMVEKFRVGDYIPWPKIVWHFENRSFRQCQERYVNHLGNIKKGSFTMQEDFVITYLASKLKNFGEVAKFIPKRVATQVRARYEYLVGLSMPHFTKEEDELLVKLIAQFGRNWGRISESFQNRSRLQCRRRWNYLQKSIKLEEEIKSESDPSDADENPELDTNKTSEKLHLDVANVRKIIPYISKPENCNRKYSIEYSNLLDHHKYCYKFLFGPRIRIPSDSEEINKLITKMILTMKTLSVNGPFQGYKIETLSENCEFNKEDFLILNHLQGREQQTRGFKLSTKIIPPNYMTLVGLRTFTQGWNTIKNIGSHHEDVPQTSKRSDSTDRILFSDAKKLFKSRLKAIFAFPIILSNIYPGGKSKPVYKKKCRRAVKPLSRRKRKEHSKLMNEAYRNKFKLVDDNDPDDGGGQPVWNEPEKNKKKKRGRPSLKRDLSELEIGDEENASEISRTSKALFKIVEEDYVTPLKKRAGRKPSSQSEVHSKENPS